jgi:hypothetical protein
MFARAILNRKWMVAAGAAAILALVIGSLVGRSIIPSTAERKPTPAPKPVTFTDRQDGIGLTYPGDWVRVHSPDPDVRLVAAKAPSTTAADAPTISLRLRVSKAPPAFTGVTERTLARVRKLTDTLLTADQRTALLSTPDAISVGGLVGYRYRYTYKTSDGKAGAHVHYFLFKGGKLIQLTFQAVPATTLSAVEPEFNRIAGTFTSTGR